MEHEDGHQEVIAPGGTMYSDLTQTYSLSFDDEEGGECAVAFSVEGSCQRGGTYKLLNKEFPSRVITADIKWEDGSDDVFEPIPDQPQAMRLRSLPKVVFCVTAGYGETTLR